MSLSTQPGNPQDDPPWEQDPSTKRWYIPWIDDYGNYTRWYYEDWYDYQVENGAIKPETIPRSVAPQKKKKPGATVVTRGSSSRSSRSLGSHSRESYANESRSEAIEVYDNSKEYYKSTGYGQYNENVGSYNREIVSNVASSAEPQDGGQTGDGQLASAVEQLTLSSSDAGTEVNYAISSAGTTQWSQSVNSSSVPIPYHPLPKAQTTSSGALGYSGLEQASWPAYGSSSAHIPTAAQNYPDHRHVAGQGNPTDGGYEELDSSYKQRSKDYKKFFRTGRVFSTLWTDPWADNTAATNYNPTFESEIFIVKYGQKVYSKIRRFVVVVYNPGDRFCKCLPVTTYDGKGAKKRGINLEEHGQIYSSTRPPSHVDGITKSPLKVDLSKSAKSLKPSYVNYGKAYTVETNVKVKDIGELDTVSRRLLRQYWNASMVVEVDSQDEDNAAGNELLGVGAGLGPATYTTDYTTSPSASSSSAYNLEYSAPVVPSSSSTSGYATAGYDTPDPNIAEDTETYPSTSSSKTEDISSTPTGTGYLTSSISMQPQFSQAQEPYEQSAQQYGQYQSDKSPSSAQYENEAASTSAMPSSPQVESILDHTISNDKNGKRILSYLVSWVGDYADSWVTDKEISQDWINFYHSTRRERREGKEKMSYAETSSTSRVEHDEEEEDPLYVVHQAQVERSRRDSSGAASSRLESKKKNSNKDRKKGNKRWYQG